MTLTWKEFLSLAAVVQNLYEDFSNFDIKINDIKEFNRRVAEVAQKYLDLFKHTKYMDITKAMRIGSDNNPSNFIYCCVLNIIYLI